jgi:protein involved in polysaccharide export with SLBB domain
MHRFVLLALCLAASAASTRAAAQDTAAVAPPPGASVQTTLRPGDLIRIQVYREETLDGEFLVDEQGYVVLPLIGEFQVTGVPVRELRQRLIAAYQQHLRNPSIIVTPLRRVSVLGDVQRPGLYTVDPTVTLVGAVAMAGGATAAGDLRRIRILRDGEVLRQRVEPGATLNVADVRSGDQIYVDRRSWFERNSTFVVSTTLSLTSIVIALLSR